jgi:uncharacterized membrane protein
MAHLKEILFIDAPVDRVDSIVRDPRQMPNFWVGMSDPERIVGDGGPGTEVAFTQLMMGVHVHTTTKTIEERHDAQGGTHWRWEFEGTTSGWLTCHHEPQGAGTQITSEMEYSVPGSVLGKVADRLVIERRQRRDFRHSLENLKMLAETSAPASEEVPE